MASAAIALIAPPPVDQLTLDRTEYGLMFAKYDTYLARFLWRKGVKDIPEAAAETWCRIWERRTSWRRECSFKAWLFHVALNVARSDWHTRRRKPDEITPRLPSRQSPLDVRVNAAMESDKVPEILVLLHAHGYTYDELRAAGYDDPKNMVRRASIKFITGRKDDGKVYGSRAQIAAGRGRDSLVL